MHHSITINSVTNAQVFEYDSLNRLKVATEQGGANWAQNFSYDRYGNRRFASGTTTISSLTDARVNPTFSATTNRIEAGQGLYAYDAAGNLTKDYDGHLFAYDAENQQVSYDSGAALYSYDGDGRRVKKETSSVVTIFVYDAAGQLVAEYGNAQTVGIGGTSYLTSDSLGTPRVATGSDGQVKARHDYLPFGEEISVGVGGRTGEIEQSRNVEQTTSGRDLTTHSTRARGSIPFMLVLSGAGCVLLARGGSLRELNYAVR